MKVYDAIIVGGGPAGASCATFCAKAGLSVLVLERAFFPRDKVCGDCLNPDCWPVLERLGIAERLRTLPHVALREVGFVSVRGRRVSFPLTDSERGEVTIKRRVLDSLLLENAVSVGADVMQGSAVCEMRESLRAAKGFDVETASAGNSKTERQLWHGSFLAAADGRNSLVVRWAGLLPERGASERVGLQTHVACPVDFGARVEMRWFKNGYGGLAPVGDGELNISLVGLPRALNDLKRWARAEFGVPDDWPWRTIAPLDRLPAKPAKDNGIFLLGDAARVVEPFTGEGIYYALRSGELAAEAIVRAVRGEVTRAQAAADYRARHGRMYQGRLWVNRLARAAALHPRLAGLALEVARWQPGLLRLLTAKVIRV